MIGRGAITGVVGEAGRRGAAVSMARAGTATLHPSPREHKKTPGRSRVLSRGQTGKCLLELSSLLHTQLSVATPEQPLELGPVDGIRLRAVG